MTSIRTAGRLRARTARRFSASSRRRAAAGGAERGESLIELIIALTIMAVAVVTIVGATATSIMMSDIHRKQATAGSYLRSYASAIQDYVNSDISGGSFNSVCSAPPAFASLTGSPVGYHGTLTCTNSARTLIQATLTVSSTDDRDTESLSLTLRRPCVAPTQATGALDPGCSTT